MRLVNSIVVRISCHGRLFIPLIISVLFVTLQWSCGEVEDSLTQQIDNNSELSGDAYGEKITFGDKESVDEAFAEGFAEVMPDLEFSAVEILLRAANSQDEVEYQVLRDMSWSEWQPLPMQTSTKKRYTGEQSYVAYLEFDDVVMGLRIRRVNGADFMDFTFESPGYGEMRPPLGSPWTLPSSTVAAGNTQNVDYDPWQGCVLSVPQNTQDFADYMVNRFGITHAQILNCRLIAGTTSQSIHGTGRAIDLFVPTLPDGDANNAIGDEAANWLVENAEKIGIQYIIWDQTSWRANRSLPKARPYGGANPHVDHLHIELTVEAKQGLTEWFVDGLDDVDPVDPVYTPYFSRDDFLTQQYVDVLGRAPDASGFAYWDGQLVGGMTEEALISFFIDGPEASVVHGTSDRVTIGYRALLRREPDAAGYSYWTGVVASAGLPTFVAGLYNSAEYSQRFSDYRPYADADDFLTQQYQDFLGRSPDAGGYAYWTNALNNGMSRYSLLAAFASAVEAQKEHSTADRVKIVYKSMLRRSPTAADITFWQNIIDTDGLEAFVYSVYWSPEYRLRMVNL